MLRQLCSYMFKMVMDGLLVIRPRMNIPDDFFGDGGDYDGEESYML